MPLHDPLKPREIEILRLMADGLSNREIAEQLFIGFETVKWYAKQIYSKLDVSSRRAAADKAQELGLLDDTVASVEHHPRNHTKHNLPTQLTSFIGRKTQIEAMKNLLADTRLLTLTGPGGTGKTRLSIHVAEQLLDNFTDGVFFVDLAPIANSENVPKVIASTLSVIENANESVIETVKRSIGERRLLLVIDNFEHVMDRASIVSDLLTAAENLKVIVTSREALRLTGEQEYPVPPLSIDNIHAEAVMLFVQRAQMVRPTFRLDDSNMDDIMAICQRVDGLPLAIELAAARCKLLTPQALLKRLDNRLASLSSGSRDAPQRQQTLQATIDWSYNLLDDGEKMLFEQLAVFCCESSLEAIESICGQNLSIDVFDGLASLVDKSMIRQVEDELGEPRFVMLETIQEYAEQRLQEHNEYDMMQRRHATYYMELVERTAPELRLSHQEWWFTKLDIEQDNIRSAMAWALSGEAAEVGLRTVAALRDYWWYQGSHDEGWRWIEHAIEFVNDVPDTIRADVFITAGIIARLRRNYTDMAQFAKDALSIYQANKNEEGIAWALLVSAFGDSTRNDETIDSVQEALNIMRAISNQVGQAMMLNALGVLLLNAEYYEQAKAAYIECSDIVKQTGERRREIFAMNGLAHIALSQKRFSEAKILFSKYIVLSHKLNFTYQLQNQLWSCVALFFVSNKMQVTYTLLGASESQQLLTGQLSNERVFKIVNSSIGELRNKFNESDTYQTAYDAGRKMSLDEAVDFALKELGK